MKRCDHINAGNFTAFCLTQPAISFRANDLDRDNPDGDYKFDNLQLTDVPESGGVFLLAFGGLALMRKGKPVNA
jgi:hypothetical protein